MNPLAEPAQVLNPYQRLPIKLTCSLSKLRIQTISIVAIPAAYSSLSHVDWAVTFCFLETDKIVWFENLSVQFSKIATVDHNIFGDENRL